MGAAAADGMISNVWIGGRGASQNPYDNMRTVLEHLDIPTGTQGAHHNHFHIDLRRPDLFNLTSNLNAESTATNQAETIAKSQISIAAQSLLSEIQSEFNFVEGDITMFLLDIPDSVPQYPQTLLVQTSHTSQSAPTVPTANRIGVCALVESPVQIIQGRYSAANSIALIGAAITYLEEYEGRKIQGTSTYQATTAKVLINPKHGTLTSTMPDPITNTSYVYLPNQDYLGKDRATFLVTVGDRKFKVEYFINAVHAVFDDYPKEEYNRLCPKNGLWKISSATELPTPSLNFADLPNGSVGQATGTNITLDTNAAGHGWFVDTTPDNNEEFLATSNPNVWIARAGSAAEGKVDMLSVLLHEYGHVLSLDHSADNGDALSPVLQPGVRKLWSETELAKLNEIIALQSTQPGQLPADYPVDYLGRRA